VQDGTYEMMTMQKWNNHESNGDDDNLLYSILSTVFGLQPGPVGPQVLDVDEKYK